jgi:hypothetical protein
MGGPLMLLRESLSGVSRMNSRTRRHAWLVWALVLAAFVVLCFVLGYTEAGIVGIVTGLLAPPAGLFGAYLARRWGLGSD